MQIEVGGRTTDEGMTIPLSGEEEKRVPPDTTLDDDWDHDEFNSPVRKTRNIQEIHDSTQPVDPIDWEYEEEVNHFSLFAGFPWPEANKEPKWRKAMEEEIHHPIKKKKTWELTSLTQGSKQTHRS